MLTFKIIGTILLSINIFILLFIFCGTLLHNELIKYKKIRFATFVDICALIFVIVALWVI